MPKLKCEVTSCGYNANNLCARGAIDLEGPAARSKKETACLSFVRKGKNAYNYEFADFEDTLKPETSVYCDAINCVFECDSRCRADRIEIKNVGYSDSIQSENETKYHEKAWKSQETMCKTFESRDN